MWKAIILDKNQKNSEKMTNYQKEGKTAVKFVNFLLIFKNFNKYFAC